MSSDDQNKIKCGKCDVPLEFWTETDEAQSGRCPSCGVTADINTINTELAEFAEARRKPGGTKKRSFRFVTD